MPASWFTGSEGELASWEGVITGSEGVLASGE